MNQTQAAKEMGITPQRFNNEVRKQFLYQLHGIKGVSKDYLNETIRKLKSPYERLFYDIFEIPDHKIIVLSKTIQKVIDEALDKCLDEKRKQLIITYYGLNGDKPKSIIKIAEEENVSKQWIDMMIKKGVKSLQSPDIWCKCIPEYDNHVKMYHETNQFQILHSDWY